MVEINIVVSALAGLGSFLSPCILPILPAFLSYLGGTAANEAQKSISSSTTQEPAAYANSKTVKDDIRPSVKPSSKISNSIQYLPKNKQLPSTTSKSLRLNIFLNTVYFVLGFSLVFSVLGVILNSILSAVGNTFQSSLTTIGGLVIMGFGVYLIASIKLRQLNVEKKLTKLPRFKTSYITSFVFGAAFAAGWTPCVGPILGSTFALASTAPGAAYNSLLAYSMGLGIPFLITGAFFAQSTRLIRKITKHLKYFNPVMGCILIVLGVLLLTNQLSLVGNIPFANEIINFQGNLFGGSQ
jgi:cytochrome c-type biogenesis protein